MQQQQSNQQPPNKFIAFRKKQLNLEEKNRRRKHILYGERVSSKHLKEMEEVIKNGALSSKGDENGEQSKQF